MRNYFVQSLLSFLLPLDEFSVERFFFQIFHFSVSAGKNHSNPLKTKFRSFLIIVLF